MCRLSLIYFFIDVIPCFFYSCFNEGTDSCKDCIEEFPWCSNSFFNVIWIIDLLFIEARVVLFNCLFDLIRLIHLLKLAIVDELSSIREDFIKIVNCWRCFKEWNGTEAAFEVRKDIGNSVFIGYLHKVDVLMDSIVEASDIDEICWFWLVAFKLSDLACS